MSAIIEVNGERATLRRWTWETDSRDLLRKLQELPMETFKPEAAVAHGAAKALGGTVISAKVVPPELDDKGRQRIY